MGIQTHVKKLASNKMVLYIVLFIALTNLLAFLFKNQYHAIVLFFAIAVLADRFTKNTLGIMIACIIITNTYLFVMSVREPKYLEGMKTKKKKATTVKGIDADQLKDLLKSDPNDILETAATFVKKNVSKPKKIKSGFTTKTPLAKHAGSVNDDAEEVKSRIDYGTTVEQAYDNLEGILGGDGMKRLTSDTTRLIEKQNKLFSNMKGMTPMIQQYSDLMKNMDLSNLTKMAKSITGSGISIPGLTQEGSN